MRCGKPPNGLGGKSFKFETAWITHEDYKNIVVNS